MFVGYTQITQSDQTNLEIEDIGLGHSILRASLMDKKSGIALTDSVFYSNIELKDPSYESVEKVLDNTPHGGDVNLIAGLWQTINLFFKEIISKSGIKEIKSSETSIVSYDINNDCSLLLFCEENKDYPYESGKILINSLEEIKEFVNNNYSKELKEFNGGNTSQFKDLEVYIHNELNHGYHNKKVLNFIEGLKQDIELCTGLAHESFMLLRKFNKLLPGLEINMDYYGDLMVNNYRKLFLEYCETLR
jgi:hypothetical protein